MALYNLGEIKKQVALMVGHDGLSAKVPKWTNRVIQDISSRIFWKRSLGVAYVAPWARAANSSVGLINMWGGAVVNNTTQYITDCINIFRVEHVQLTTSGTATTQVAVTFRKAPVSRIAIQDLYARYAGQNYSLSSDTIQHYAIPIWEGDTYGGTQTRFIAPQFAVYPMWTGTGVTDAGALEVTYLRSPEPLTTDDQPAVTDVCSWMFKKYFHVVLTGVMCYARIYVGDIQGYLLEKSDFENGIQDMIRHEETVTADTPVRRAMTEINMANVE